MALELFEQIILFSSLVIGSMVGERAASHTLGKPHRKSVAIIELILYVFFLIIIQSSMGVFYIDVVSIALFNFIVGLGLVLVIRFLTTLAGAYGAVRKGVPLSRLTQDEESLILVAKLLSMFGYESGEIKRILRELGFSKGLSLLDLENIKDSVPPVLTRIALLEEAVNRLEREISAKGAKKAPRKAPKRTK